MATTPVSNGSGQLKIVGSMDTTNIDKGFKQVDRGFTNTKGQAKSFGSDMKRTGIVVSGIAKKLLLMGTAGATAMVGIASKAPAVAPALAKMSVSFDKISRNLGEALAPAFERVAGGLEKFSTWVASNKDKIGDIANKFLDMAVSIGTKLWPVLKDIGSWAADHPTLFTGILAGLALGPTIIAGIGSITGLVGTLTGATVGASLLTALGYLAALGGVAYGGFKTSQALVNTLNDKTGMTGEGIAAGGTDMSGQTLLRRLPQKIASDITGNPTPYEDINVPGTPGSLNSLAAEGFTKESILAEARQSGGNLVPNTRIEAGERRGWFLQLWDSVWG